MCERERERERERDLFGVGNDGSFTSEAIGSNLGSERRIRSHFSVFCVFGNKKNGVGFDLSLSLSLSLSMYHSMYASPIYSLTQLYFNYLYIYWGKRGLSFYVFYFARNWCRCASVRFFGSIRFNVPINHTWLSLHMPSMCDNQKMTQQFRG